MTRRTFVALGLGALVAVDRRRISTATAGGAPNAWFWEIVGAAEADPPTSGPRAGFLDNSMFGVEAHGPGGKTAVDAFYLKAELDPDATLGAPWDVGVVWRISDKMDALWWTVTSEGHWQLDRAIWALSPRAPQALVAGELCTVIESPVRVQAIAVGSVMAWSVNGGSVTAAPIPADRQPGPVAIVANAQEAHRRPDGRTAYRQLSLWALDRDAMAEVIPDKIAAGRC